jgi:hypothetical protein
MAFIKEFPCGCIRHELVGFIRRCEGMTSRSLSGRVAPKSDHAEMKHNNAMNDGKTVQEWTVAEVLP